MASVYSALWNVPYKQNPYFTGHEDTLRYLHQSLQEINTVGLTQAQGISGLGGIGKTQIAIEFAYRYRLEYDAVFWVLADSITTLISSFLKIAHLLQLPELQEKDPSICVEAVLRWLRLHTQWLVIFDNMDDLELAKQFLPQAGPGHVLFTTRAHAFVNIGQRLEISQMNPETGALLLLRRASLLPLREALSSTHFDNWRLAQTISQQLDGLPLALDQAGAYIKEVRCSLEDYLTRFQDRRSDLLHVRGRFHQNYPASVATTWSLSFEKVRQARPAAAELLNFCAFLAPDEIPEGLFEIGAPCLGDILGPVCAHPIQFDLACKEALRFSLIIRNDESETLIIHRLVQAVLQENIPLNQPVWQQIQQAFGKSLPVITQKDWKHRAVLAMSAVLLHMDKIDRKQWDTWEQQYLPHALVCTTWIAQEQIRNADGAFLLSKTGDFLENRARYREAEPLYQRAIAISTQQLGTKHPLFAHIFNNLAFLYCSQGKYREAEPLYHRALAIARRLFEGNEQATAQILNNLAILYQSEGRYDEARPILEEALAIRQQKFGETHPDVAQSLSTLSFLLTNLGDYKEAELLCLQALAIYEQQLGVEHRETANSLSNLATLYLHQSKYREAEPLYLRSLAMTEKLLGADHPAVATDLNNLANLYKFQERYKEAEPLYLRSLAIMEQQLGADHPDISTILNNLAKLYQVQGKYKEAEASYLRALAIMEQLGTDHPKIPGLLSNLAEFYQEQGKYGEVEPLLQRALAISERQLGSEHFQTAAILRGLADYYQDQDKYAEAETLYQRSLRVIEQQLGSEHIQVAICLHNLALLYRLQGRYEEAEPLFLRALEIVEQKRGPEHSETAAALDNLAKAYTQWGKYKEAEPLLRRALAIFERQLGREHYQTAVVLNNLAELYQEQGKFSEAESLLLRTLAIIERQLGNKHPQTALVLNNLAGLYEEQGKFSEAEPLRQRAQTIGDLLKASIQ